MKKKLPSIFANEINKNLSNSQKVFYSIDKKGNVDTGKAKNSNDKTDVSAKIRKILSDNKYNYKFDVIITTKNEELKKTIIGRNRYHLVTKNDELIPIEDIIDIKLNK